MASQIQIRRDSSANWNSINPILAQGEFGLEIDTGKIKCGDGITVWNSLEYFLGANKVQLEDTGNLFTATDVEGALAEVKDDVARHMAENAKFMVNVMSPPYPLVAAIGDGITDDSDAINACIQYVANQYGGGTVYLPQNDFAIGSTILMPDKIPILIKGNGNSESQNGTRITWIGGNDDSVIEINDCNHIKNLFIRNGNNASGVVALDCIGSAGGRSPSRIILNNIRVKGFALGFGLAWGYYNTLIECSMTYCDIGYKFGLQANNTGLYGCHANMCGKGIVTHEGASRQIGYYSCSLESSTDCAIDMSATYAVCWTFEGLYLENNKQSAKIRGTVTFNEVYINADWVNTVDNDSLACFEIQSTGAGGIKFDHMYFTGGIPLDKHYYFSDCPATGTKHSIKFGTQHGSGLASCLALDIYATSSAFNNGLIDIEHSQIKLVKTPILDASTVQLDNIIPPMDAEYRGYTLIGAYLLITQAIVVDDTYPSLDIRVGRTVAASYGDYVNYSSGGALPVGKVKLPMVTNTHIVSPEHYKYRMNNSRALSGKYQVVLILAM